MGQAKNRGTYEERKAIAIYNRRAEDDRDKHEKEIHYYHVL